MALRKATRANARLSMLLDGPSGAGKTFTGLLVATALTKKYGGRIAVIDSQGGQAEMHLGSPLPDGTPIDFDINVLKDTHPSTYVAAITEAENSPEHRVILIDSLSHAWVGEDGVLAQKDKIGGGGPQPWAQVAPLQHRLVNRLINCKKHLIATCRVKTDRVWEKGEDGKTIPRTLGLKMVQKEGVEYEFGLWASLDDYHSLRVNNARSCKALDRAILPLPDRNLTDPILEWLETGTTTTAEPEPGERMADPQMVEEYIRLAMEKTKWTRAAVEEEFYLKNQNTDIAHAPYALLAEKLSKLKAATLPAAKK